jgi:hypothetical protein
MTQILVMSRPNTCRLIQNIDDEVRRWKYPFNYDSVELNECRCSGKYTGVVGSLLYKVKHKLR